ncbi:uncharacterized protein FMAN_09600 [Fusarium mangiferae]|uniref:Transcription factor domain-containing protein n=1 Tax=Fusarium mangiferae TaxID=192010 RepID=A0A1L7T7I4_FUSMA|nr:uncharacterized protein FMAN_09600 [Fusarium mangiferae]CVK91525.1 uncharacterized protein FMAN_09600 [Fusarium mangiferae]
MTPLTEPEQSLLYISVFKTFILPIFPIVSIQDIDSFWHRWMSSESTCIELVCLSLIIETGSLISALQRQANTGQTILHSQIRSRRIADAARYIRIEEQHDLSFTQACLLMCVFLRHIAQSGEEYLLKASHSLKNILSTPGLFQNHSESVTLMWLSWACLAFETPQKGVLEPFMSASQLQNFPLSPRLHELFGTSFAITQRRRLQWLGEHINKSWTPDNFDTQTFDIRLNCYLNAELRKSKIVLPHTMSRHEFNGAHKSFMLAAQALDAGDRIRNLKFEAHSALTISSKIDYQEWIEVSRPTLCALYLLFSFSTELEMLYQEFSAHLMPMVPSVLASHLDWDGEFTVES